MGYQGFTVIDSDGHVTEPWSLYATYTEEPYRERAQTLVERGNQIGGINVLNELYHGRYWQPRRRPLGAREQWEITPDFKMGNQVRHYKARPKAGEDPHDTIKDLDALGMDVFTGFPSRAPRLCGGHYPMCAAAVVRGCVKWMRDC